MMRSETSSGGGIRKLLEPIEIGPVLLENRITMAPTNDNLAFPDGFTSEYQVRYWERRAKGGPGLIIAGNAYVECETGRITTNQMGCYHDKLIPGLRRLTESVHAYGVPVLLQIVHGGRQALPAALSGAQPVAPSPVPAEGKEVPRELTAPEIEQVAKRFVEAAVRAKKSNFDGVEIHCAYGYLLSEFLSPNVNRRADEYGGNLKGRMKLPLEIIGEVRERVGDEMAVGVRFNGNDYVEGGVTPDMALEEGRMFAEAGVDYLAISGGVGDTVYMTEQPCYVPMAPCLPYSEMLKKSVDTPVFAVGSMGDPLLAERILREGRADVIQMARPLIVDPDLPNKVKEGRLDEILMCIRCNECIGSIYTGHVECTLNPEVGNEGRFDVAPAEEKKRVVVVGGGPGGMEAALTARLRGHEVVLFEMKDRLGGLCIPKHNPDFKKELEHMPRYFSARFARLGVKVLLGREATVKTVEELKPDVVVVATGSAPVKPDTPGMDRPHVVTAYDLLNEGEGKGGEALVVGGGMLGCEVALDLAGKGRKVTLALRRDRSHLAEDCNPVSRKWLVKEMERVGVRVIERCAISSVEDDGAVCIIDGSKRKVPADLLVTAVGFTPRRGLADALRSKGYKVHVIGDALEPRTIYSAVREGFHVARRL